MTALDTPVRSNETALFRSAVAGSSKSAPVRQVAHPFKLFEGRHWGLTLTAQQPNTSDFRRFSRPLQRDCEFSKTF